MSRTVVRTTKNSTKASRTDPTTRAEPEQRGMLDSDNEEERSLKGDETGKEEGRVEARLTSRTAPGGGEGDDDRHGDDDNDSSSDSNGSRDEDDDSNSDDRNRQADRDAKMILAVGAISTIGRVRSGRGGNVK